MIVRVARHEQDLLAQIESGALDSRTPLSDALRKCVALGGQSGSTELLDWANRELTGYGSQEPPAYRIVAAQIVLDGTRGNLKITGQGLSPTELPDFTHGHIKEEYELRGGVGEIEAMISHAQNGAVQLGLPMGQDLARVMNYENKDPYQHIERVYWKVSTVALIGALDQIRTALVRLVAEMRWAGTSAGGDAPTGQAADQAVNVVVHGAPRSKITVNTSQASGGSTNSVAQPREPESGWWTRGRRIGAAVVGLATIAAAYATVAVWQGWSWPF